MTVELHRNQPSNDPMMLVVSLINQVMKATPKGGNETQVVTLISRPMWRKFQLALGGNPNSKPTPMQGLNTNRVYGSETHIVESKAIYAVSFPRP